MNSYELFEDNVVDFSYLLFDINRMDKEDLVEVADLVSIIFLLDQDIEIEEIINRLKFVGKLLGRKATTQQIKIFRNWIINILKNRLDSDLLEHVESVLIETSEMEVDNMVSNLGRKLDEELKNRKEEGIKEGEHKKAIEIAKSLLDVLDVPTIAKKTGLSEEEIEKLKH